MLFRSIAQGLELAGFDILNRVTLNQILVRAHTDELTVAAREAVQASGEAWFGATVWQGRPAFRISVSSWRTTEHEADALVQLLTGIAKRR